MLHLHFQTASTIDEAKKEYKELYIINCSNAEVMADINMQFTAFKKAFEIGVIPNLPEPQTEENTASNEVTGNNTCTSSDIAKLAKEIALTEGTNVEICGTWIFVKCDKLNRPAHEVLKAHGFRWSNNKNAWWFTNKKLGGKRRGTKSLPQIRVKHGSEQVKAD